MTDSSVDLSLSEPSRPLRVFLCHSSDDKPAVRNLYRKLVDDGFAPWLDEENLEAGQEWEKEIPRAVRDSDVVIVCISRRSANKRGYVQKEIKFALDVADEQPEGSIFLIPARLENCDVPDRLRRWQWVNLFEEQGHHRLLKALRLCSNKLGITVEAPSVIEERIFGGIYQTITLLFADIRGFTNIAEHLPAERTVEFLNQNFSAMSKIIVEHSGIINQYLGGGLMALFGVPVATPNDAYCAVGAAVAMQRQMLVINEHLPAMGLPEVKIGIGIHTGQAIVGINGSEVGSEYIVVGDTVDTADRLEANSRPQQILLSEETARAAGDLQWPLHPMEPVMVKGRAQALSLFELDWQHEGRVSMK